MKRHKYPAPFDEPEPSRWEQLQQLYADPNAPLPPSPPLPVDIPMEKPSAARAPSLYRDLFGDDTSVLVTALEAPWSSEQQRELAAEILSGRKSMRSLSTPDWELLDGLARNFNEGGELHAEVRQADSERLPIPDSEDDGGDEDEDVQSEGGSDLQSDVSPHPGAYDWLEEGSVK